jgi:t-SNARE complex subunit (syntaxin)
MDNFILQKFRDEVARRIARAERIRNIFVGIIFVILLMALVYIVTKQYSLSKYFFL